MKEFESFLSSANQQESDAQAAKEAFDRIESAKQKIFGVSAAKALLETGEADSLRQKLTKLQNEFSLKKLSESDLQQ